ncbi:MAG: HAD family hydrolase [Puniceicoccaceae bacterium]|nr:MAG: HAD family hydrolase [Puniceicoccaceae bacterium]
MPILRLNPEAVIFDLDGTLLDSMPMVREGFSHAISPWREPPSPEEFREYFGGSAQSVLRQMLGGDDFVEAAWERLVAFHEKVRAEARPFDGAVRLLGLLAGAGLSLGVWTSRDRWSATNLLQAHGMEHYFTALVCGDDLHSHKPDPAGLVRLLAELKVRPGRALYVGDSQVDVEGGWGAGVPTVFVGPKSFLRGVWQERCMRIVANQAVAYTMIEAFCLPRGSAAQG